MCFYYFNSATRKTVLSFYYCHLYLCSLPPVAGEQRGDPDEDVDGVEVDADAGVHGVERSRTIPDRVALSLVRDYLTNASVDTR